MASTLKIPTNKEEEAAVQKALAQYQMSRIQAVKDFMDGEVVSALLAGVATLIEEGLPVGSSALGNLQQLSGWFLRARNELDVDAQGLDDVLNPKEAPKVVTPQVPSPIPPAVNRVPLV